MKRLDPFSIIIATYTGTDTITGTFKSLLDQQSPNAKHEIIVVIDGPNEILKQKVDNAKQDFEKKGISFTVTQFSMNQGRFAARLAGARMAKYKHILIIDDRVLIPDDYLRMVTEANEEYLMPDVKESDAKNFVSLTLNKLRHKIYGQEWGGKFKPFYIDKDNFDRSAKGTTSIWLNKRFFIRACEKYIAENKDTQRSSDDTLILKNMVEDGARIFKTSEISVAYIPRATSVEELVHIYHRGPKFIDYYLHFGRRYFWPLVLFFLSILPVLIVVILRPLGLVFIIGALLITSLWISSNLKHWFKVSCGISSILLFFGAGLWAGLIYKVMSRKNRS